VQEVVLAMLAKEPSHGYELRSRLREAGTACYSPAGGVLSSRPAYWVQLTRASCRPGADRMDEMWSAIFP